MSTPSANFDDVEIRDLGPANCAHPEGKRWWERHQPLAEVWLRKQLAGGLQSVELAEHAAWGLLQVPELRGDGHVPGEPIRKAYSWDEIEAYEILFHYIVYGGIWEDWDPEQYLSLMGSFARYLGERGVIPMAEHVALQVEYELWAERLLQVWNEGGWYRPDGTYLPPDEPDRHDREADRSTVTTAERATVTTVERGCSAKKRNQRNKKRRHQKLSRRRNR